MRAELDQTRGQLQDKQRVSAEELRRSERALNEACKEFQAQSSHAVEQERQAARQLQSQLDAEKRNAADLDKRNTVLQEADRQSAEQKQELKSQIYTLRGEKDDARKELLQAKDELCRKESDLQAAGARNASAEKEASERLDAVLDQLAAEAERTKALQDQLEKAKDRAEQLQASRDTALEEARRNTDNTKETIGECKRLAGQKADLEKMVADLRAERDASQQRAVTSEAALKGAEEQLV